MEKQHKNNFSIFENATVPLSGDSQVTVQRIPTPWLPESYRLDDISDCLALLNDDERDQLTKVTTNTTSTENLNLWIFKPSCSNRGRGVYVLRGGDELKELIYEYQPSLVPSNRLSLLPASNTWSPKDPISARISPKGLVQKYLTNPLLVDGFKFDIRCYLLVARNDPSYIVYYHPGYIR